MALFSLFRKDPLKEPAHALYTQCGEYARKIEFFTRLEVADTFDGRFDMLALHVYFGLRRLRRAAEAAEAVGDEAAGQKFRTIAQHVTDVAFGDFDRSLRMHGVSDTGIGKRVKKMTKAFYGRLKAYDEALADPSVDMNDVVARNIYRGEDVGADALQNMVAYLRQESVGRDDDRTKDGELSAGRIEFGAIPAQVQRN